MSGTAWLLIAILGSLGSVACVYALYGDKKRGAAALKALDPRFEALDMRLRYTPEEAFACLDAVGAEGRRLLKRLWKIDGAFSLFLLAVLAVASRNIVSLRPLRYTMYGLATLRTLLDWCENAALFRLCASYPEKKEGLARVAGGLTFAKWIAAGLWVACMFGCLLVSGYLQGK